MPQDQIERVEEVFHQARELDPVERAAFLDQACENDPDLRIEVESLLVHADDITERIDLSPSGDGFQVVLADRDEAETTESLVDRGPVAEGAGTKIGRYKILQKIGEGGFGVVYMAEQEEPVQRKVALKIIKLGMDTKQVIARFEAERQALALMDHSNIARVLDAGATETGRPFFVMELVKGIPITEYCDKNRLPTADRLHLFMKVCFAVQHAHQKGIIHRDLKPTNVLVTLHDNQPVPKVIDFGIAKATSRQLTEKTLFTEFRQFLGTPEYMSPDQAEISGLDVDTRTDIYSLGVILYELLTGTTPLDARTLRSKGYGELQRLIQETEPPLPSTRMHTLAAEESGVNIAHQRQSEPMSLSRLMRGDLDWIVMKAIEKDRTRRYQSATEFAMDIQHHLNREPVIAGPPSVIYKFVKFINRHRVGVSAGCLVALALIIGLVFATFGLIEAKREADRSQEIADFLQDLFITTNPEQALMSDIDVEQTAAKAGKVFGGDHATVAATLSSRAVQLQSSGNLEAAEDMYKESLRIWRSQFGDSNINVASTLSQYGVLLMLKGDNAAAESALLEALEIYNNLPNHPGVAICEPMAVLSQILVNQGAYTEAESYLREAIEIRRKYAPNQKLQLAITVNSLTNIIAMVGNEEQLLAILPEGIQTWREAIPGDNPMLGRILVQFSMVYRRYGDPADSEPLLREALETFRSVEEPPLADYALALGMLSRSKEEGGDLEEALGLAHEIVAISSNTPDDSIHTEAVRDLGNLAWRIGRTQDLSDDVYASAAAAIERALEERPGDRAFLNTLGVIQYRQEKYEEALKTFALSHAQYLLEYETGVPADLAFMAMAHEKLGHHAEAQEIMRQLSAAMENPEFASSSENRQHWQEAMTLIGTTPIGPEEEE